MRNPDLAPLVSGSSAVRCRPNAVAGTKSSLFRQSAPNGRTWIGEQALFSLTRPPPDRYGERVGEPGPVHPESLTASARGNRASFDRHQGR